MALLRGKFISADEAIKQNVDPSAPEDLARKLYVDNLVANIDLSSKVSKDGDTMTGGLRIEGTSPGAYNTQLSLHQLIQETPFAAPELLTITRLVDSTANLRNSAAFVRTAYNSAILNTTGDLNLIRSQINAVDSNTCELTYSEVTLGNVDGYAGNIESYHNITSLSQGFWENYTSIAIDTISGGGLHGVQLTGGVSNMPGTQEVTGFDFAASIGNKELGEVSAFKHASSVAFTDAGTYKGLNLSPAITGGAARTGVYVDMSASSGSVELKTRSIDARGNSFFQGNMFVDQAYLVSSPSQLEEFPTSGYGYLDYTEMGFYDDVVNRSCRVTLDFVSLYSPDSGRSTVGIGQIELVDSSNQPSMPAGDAYVATKKYVDTVVEPLTTATDQDVPNTLVKRDNTGGFNATQMYFHDQNIPLGNVYGYVDYTEMGLYNYDEGRYSILYFDKLKIAHPEGESVVGIGEITLKDASGLPAIPTLDEQVTTKKYVDQQLGATLKVPHKENFVLTNTDISNGYVDLTRLAVDESTVINLGGIEQHEGDDYTVSTVGGVTRLTFIGPLLAAVVPGDKVYTRYWSLD